MDLLIKQREDVGDEILLHKKQGQEYPRLLPTDFCLIFMNRAQESILYKFASNILAIDSTHGLNMYDFELTTMMVLMSLVKDFQFAACFQIVKMQLYMKYFLIVLKQGVEYYIPTYLCRTLHLCTIKLNIMGTAILNRLYCSWHIDRALNKITIADKKKEDYQTLKVLQNTLDVAEFQRNITTFVKSLLEDPDTQIFGSYIIQNYTNNCNMWAYRFRKNLGINTNIFGMNK